MGRLTSRLTLATAGLLALASWTVVPGGIDAARLIQAADDPVRLAEIGLGKNVNAAVVAREIEFAFAAGDAELAQSFLALAEERGLPVEPVLRAKVEQANGQAATAVRAAGRFVDGFVIGQPTDLTGLFGTITGDLFVYGDLRDAVRETARLVRGQEADELILGLACVGLAVTAGTYATFGAGAPARVGLSVLKAAGKTGRLSAKMARAVLQPLRAAVDTAALRNTLKPQALLQPAAAVRGVRAAIKIEKTQGLVRVLGDVGRINAKAGTRAALDGLKLADGPKDVARLARLAEANGGKTRAILKILGRSAIMLTVGLFELASWMFWALLNLLALVVALKRGTERVTLRYIHRAKRRMPPQFTLAAPGVR